MLALRRGAVDFDLMLRETDFGETIELESIATCVMVGVSLRGGIGRVETVVMGAFFIAQVSSYLQTVLLRALLILAVIFDQMRHRIITSGT